MCQSCQKWKDGICDVHKLVYKDNEKRKVKYCKTCNAYICADCERNYPARLMAVIKDKLKNG